MKKVLVVDFDVEFLKSVSLMLREEGFEIITAVDGQAGLERFEADKPDLVVLEAMLPRLHGFELCARITENQTHAAPVIVITGVYRDALYKTEALRTFGATAYFEKPVDMTRLLEAIHKALSTTAPGAQAPEPKKAPAPGERPPLRPAARPAAQAPGAAAAAVQVKPQPVLRPQPPPRVQAAPAVTPVVTPPVIPAKKKDADEIEIDSLLKSALAELGLEPEQPKTPPKPVVASPSAVQPPPRPVAPPPPPRPIQPPPRPAAAPFIPPSAKPVAPAAPPVQPKPVIPVPPPRPPVPPVVKPVPPPQPKPIAPAPPVPPAPPVVKPVPPPQPKPIAPAPPVPPAPPVAKPVPPPQPKPVAPAPPVPEPPPPAPPVQRPKPAIVAPPPPIPVPRPTPPPPAPAPPPLRQPTPEKLPVFDKSIETHVHAPAVPVMEMPERRAHAPAFPEFMAEPKKKSSPVIFIAAAAVLGVAALGYFLVLKPKGPETTPIVSQGQPPPVVSERASVENAPRFESQPAAKPAVKTPTGTAKPKPTPPPAVKPEPEATTPATQPVIPIGEPKLEIQVPEQTAPQATAKPATEQTTTAAQSTVAPPPADAAPAAPAKAQTGQLVSLDDVETPPRVVTRVDPSYPPIAYRMGIQGTVWINALISETGNVLQAIFLRGTTAGGLDKAAETAVLKWKYQPAQKDGVNVKVWLPVRVDFVKRS